MQGEANPNFKDGAWLGHYTRAFVQMSALMRQNTICQECQSGEDLVVHHIDETKNNDAGTNLLVLCRGCHMKFHKSKDSDLRRSMTSKWKKIVASSAKAS
jgi:5-methylcytosine-specific restriction endonuclease McrA